mgnify:CR=1 FL=1
MERIREWLGQGNSILVLPGWKDSGPDHWQSHWERDLPGLRRVQQDNWHEPVAADWVGNLNEAIVTAPVRVSLVAHSLGCIVQAHWAIVHRRDCPRIAGALLVAPADPVYEGLTGHIRGFLPMPVLSLPYPSLVIASDNDPTCDIERAYFLGQTWGSRQIVLKNAGHINVDSGFGPWPEGLRHLSDLIIEANGTEVA